MASTRLLCPVEAFLFIEQQESVILATIPPEPPGSSGKPYHLRNRFTINQQEQSQFLRNLLKWQLLGSLVGVLGGTASALFLFALTWATALRVANPALLFALPVAGFAIGWFYLRFAGVTSRGNNLVIEEVNLNQGHIPLRMAPLVLVGTVVTHLFGGSAGREGTAIQMGTSLADTLYRVLGLNSIDRRLMLMAGISGGFGSVFGTPVAGFIFGMEVQTIGRIRYEGVVPCLTAALVGDLVTRAWGAPHAHYPPMAITGIESGLLLRVVLAGIAFGLASLVFIELIHAIKYTVKRYLSYAPWQVFAGGVAIIALTLAMGTTDYLGLSLPLITASMDGTGVVTFAFLFKLIFTAVTLGTGFLGGEVTPLFVIGATLGYTLGRLLGIDPAFLAAVGFVAVFAGASNTPIACTLMGVELFGGGAVMYLAVGCFVAYLASGHRGIYSTQLIGTPKTLGSEAWQPDESLEAYERRRLQEIEERNGER